MERIILPSDEALQARSAELAASKQDQEKAAWYAKISELKASIIAIEQQIASLHAQAECGDYHTSPRNKEQLELQELAQKQAEYRRHQLIEKIRHVLGVLSLRDNEPIVQHYRTRYEYAIGMGEGYIERDTAELFCVQGDTILYAREESPTAGDASYIPEDAVTVGSIPRGTTAMQLLFHPALTAPFIRRDICVTDTDTRNYSFASVGFAIEGLLEAVERIRINRLVERGAACLRQSGVHAGLEQWSDNEYITYRQTRVLTQGERVILDAQYIANVSHATTLQRQLAGNQQEQRLRWLRIEQIDATGAKKSIKLDKTYLQAETPYRPENRLNLAEAENLIAQITEERL